MSQYHLAQATIATSIFLWALGFAYSEYGVWAGTTLVAMGAVVAILLNRRLSLPLSLVIAASSFAVYLHGAIV
jgi:hypothetical protein